MDVADSHNLFKSFRPICDKSELWYHCVIPKIISQKLLQFAQIMGKALPIGTKKKIHKDFYKAC